MALSYVNQSERDDFAHALKSRTRSIDEFDVSDTPQYPPSSGEIGGAFGSIRIKSRATGIERTYSTGGISVTHSPYIEWVEAFVRDLDAGSFE